jgi:hypothetical protein
MMEVRRSGELGGARLKFLITMVIIGSIAYTTYLYVPVAYQAYMLKDLMQHNVDVAGSQGYAPNWVAEQLAKVGPEYGLPPTAEITPAQRDNRIEVRVQYTKAIEFPGYTYQYEFDHTAKSTAFLNFK